MTQQQKQVISSLETSQGNYDIGATFDNVYLEEDGITLRTFYNQVQQFFKEAGFIRYSDDAPVSNQVKIWYNTTEEPDDEETSDSGEDSGSNGD